MKNKKKPLTQRLEATAKSLMLFAGSHPYNRKIVELLREAVKALKK